MPETSSMRVGFGLGSNLGDRGEAIQKAFSFLESQGHDLLKSSIYESYPVDCPPESPMFLNAAAELSYEGDLLDLLQACQEFERKQGRPDIRSKNEPRPVDVDLLYAGEEIVKEPRLTLPHPRLYQREFVLHPLMEICPDRMIPGVGLVRELWRKLQASEENQVCRKIA